MSSLSAAWRGLRAQPGFAVVAVLTMALAVGANTAIFSAYDQLVLHPVTIPDPDSLVAIWFNNPQRNVQTWSSSVPRFDEMREDTSVFSSYGLSAFDNVTLTGRGEPLQLTALRVNATFLPTLGVLPSRGRNFVAAEDVSNGPAVCILADELWQSRFGGDPAIVGQAIQLDGGSWQVIGVMPPHLSAPFGQVQIVIPRVFEGSGLTPAQVAVGATFAQPIARLRPGLTIDQARQRLVAFSAAYRQRHPANLDAGNVSDPRSFVGSLVGGVQPTMVTLVGAVACVLLIACANIAALFLSRLLSRSKEIAVRLSLGATRALVVRQCLAESFVVSLVAGVVGVGLTLGALRALQVVVASQLPPNTVLAMHWRAFAFTAFVTIVTTVLTGLVPALQASRPAMVEELKDAGRGSSSARGAGFRRGLVVGEVGLCVVLLVGAGLLLTTFLKLEAAPLGFESAGVASASVTLSASRYNTPDRQVDFFARVIGHLAAEPGVISAAAAANMPLNCCFRTAYGLAGVPLPPAGQRPVVNLNVVTEGYFSMLRIQLAGGRFFTADDRSGGPGVCIVNETFGRKLFAGQSAVGQSLLIGAGRKTEIVGVIRDVKDLGASAATPEELYLPLTQLPQAVSIVAARTTGDPAMLEGAFRRAVLATDPTLAVSTFVTLPSTVATSLGPQRLAATLLTLFAGLALALALTGLYAVLAYLVAQRRIEIGIRMALGASRRRVIGLMMQSGLSLVGVGLALGLVVAGLAARAIRQQLFGVPPVDVTLDVTVAGCFAVVAALACLLPSWRASRIDPLVAFRLK